MEKEQHGKKDRTDKALHEVYVTKDFGSERKEELRAFIDKHITDFKGTIKPNPGIPLMLFDRKQDAQKFADELCAKLDIHKEHIEVKAQKFTR
jgi:hypothetical protein